MSYRIFKGLVETNKTRLATVFERERPLWSQEFQKPSRNAALRNLYDTSQSLYDTSHYIKNQGLVETSKARLGEIFGFG